MQASDLGCEPRVLEGLIGLNPLRWIQLQALNYEVLNVAVMLFPVSVTEGYRSRAYLPEGIS